MLHGYTQLYTQLYTDSNKKKYIDILAKVTKITNEDILSKKEENKCNKIIKRCRK